MPLIEAGIIIIHTTQIAWDKIEIIILMVTIINTITMVEVIKITTGKDWEVDQEILAKNE